jgi:hypothetical protein
MVWIYGAGRRTFESYRPPARASGAIHCGVPTNVFLLLPLLASCADTPKSQIWIRPSSLTRMFAAGYMLVLPVQLWPAATHP